MRKSIYKLFLLLGIGLIFTPKAVWCAGGGPFIDTYDDLYNESYQECVKILNIYAFPSSCNRAMVECLNKISECEVATLHCTRSGNSVTCDDTGFQNPAVACQSEVSSDLLSRHFLEDHSCPDDVGQGSVDLSQPGCGNKVIEMGEGCDDGNTQSGDGCSNQCTKETGVVTSASTTSSPSPTSNNVGATEAGGCSLATGMETANASSTFLLFALGGVPMMAQRFKRK